MLEGRNFEKSLVIINVDVPGRSMCKILIQKW